MTVYIMGFSVLSGVVTISAQFCSTPSLVIVLLNCACKVALRTCTMYDHMLYSCAVPTYDHTTMTRCNSTC